MNAATNLLDVLRSHADAVQTFRADVTMVRKQGSDRQQIGKALRQMAEYARQAEPAAVIDGLIRNAEFSETVRPPETQRLRYFWSAPDKARLDFLGPSADADAAEAPGRENAKVFVGDRWKSYRVHSAPVPITAEPATLVIHKEDPTNGIWIEVARGAGIRVPQNFKYKDIPTHPLSPWAAGMTQMPWEELLGRIDEESIEHSTAPPPSGSTALPMLEMATEHDARWKLPLNRWRVWFDPAHGFCIVALESRGLTRHGFGFSGELVYLRSHLAEWSDPIKLADGTEFFRRCVCREYQQSLAAMDNIPSEADDWPLTTYEDLRDEYTFSDIAINEPADKGSFDVTPMVGTNVIDEIEGYRYYVGSAGEELQKTTLNPRNPGCVR